MHENIRKWLDDFDNAANRCKLDIQTKEDEDIVTYYELDLAKAIMQDVIDYEKVAKIILAFKENN